MRRPRIDQVASGLVAVAGLGFLIYLWVAPTTVVSTPTQVSQLELVGLNPIPMYTGAQPVSASESAAFTASISAAAIYAMDVPTASILLEKGSRSFRSPASTTKLMTALISLDVYEPNQVLTVKEEFTTEGAVIGLQAGESMTVRDLLAGLLVQSGNDAAMVLANNHPQGVTGFTEAMNQKASQIGLVDTQFTNPAGLDGAAHYSTARDLAILSREVMKNPVLMEIVRTKQITVGDTTLQINHPLRNTNELLLTEPGVIGIKTGTTELAGEVLITQYQRDGREILVVMMGSQNRYWETKQIYNWIFEHYTWKSPDSATLN